MVADLGARTFAEAQLCKIQQSGAWPATAGRFAIPVGQRFPVANWAIRTGRTAQHIHFRRDVMYLLSAFPSVSPTHRAGPS